MYYLFWSHNQTDILEPFDTYQDAIDYAEALIDSASGYPNKIEWHDGRIVLRFRVWA